MVTIRHDHAGADYYRRLYAFALEAREVTDADEAAAECTGKYGFSSAALAGLGYTEQVISSSITFNNQRRKYSMDYIRGKSTLVVTARPNQPIAISQIYLYKPSDVPALLNLEAADL